MVEVLNVQATRIAFEAFMKGDVDTMMAAIADETVWHVPGSNRFSGEFRGKAAVMERFQAMGEAGARSVLDEIHDIVGNDEHVVALVRISVHGTGGSGSTNAVWVMHVRDGKMIEFWGSNEDQAAVDRVFG